jgi:DNA-binding response OmpR family regulator
MTFLIIDDDKNITMMLQTYFESQKIPCKIANDGKSALEAIRKQRFDVILLDLAMPGFSGFDVLDQLKKENLVELNNILIITATKLNDNEAQDLLSNGVRRIIKKPFSLSELRKEIEEIDS